MMLDKWKRSTKVSLYKNKGNIQNCYNYKGIKSLSHIINLGIGGKDEGVERCVYF